jgi:hypothetical protein
MIVPNVGSAELSGSAKIRRGQLIGANPDALACVTLMPCFCP